MWSVATICMVRAHFYNTYPHVYAYAYSYTQYTYHIYGVRNTYNMYVCIYRSYFSANSSLATPFTASSGSSSLCEYTDSHSVDVYIWRDMCVHI